MNGKTFWIASLTWGLPMTLIGIIIGIGLLVSGHKPKKHHCLIYFEVGRGWGGFNCGPIFFINQKPSKYAIEHESGHGVQNIIFGWFMPFIVGIPSAIRYHYREYLVKHQEVKRNTLPKYDAAWFEGQATELGKKFFPATSK